MAYTAVVRNPTAAHFSASCGFRHRFPVASCASDIRLINKKTDVLLLSQNQELARLRAKVLEFSCCTVRVPKDREEAVSMLLTRVPDVLVIAYSISMNCCDHFESLRIETHMGRRLHSAMDSADTLISAVTGTTRE